MPPSPVKSSRFIAEARVPAGDGRGSPTIARIAASFPCVRVIDHESRYVNVAFDLATGEIWSCNYDPTNSQVHITLPFREQLGYCFLNDQCQGEADAVTVGTGGGAFLYARSLHFAENDMWYVASEGCDETLETPFWFSLGGNECGGPGSGARMYPIKRVPDWVKDLLPQSPVHAPRRVRLSHSVKVLAIARHTLNRQVPPEIVRAW